MCVGVCVCRVGSVLFFLPCLFFARRDLTNLALAQLIRLAHASGKAATAEAAAINNFRLDGDSAVWYDAVTPETHHCGTCRFPTQVPSRHVNLGRRECLMLFGLRSATKMVPDTDAWSSATALVVSKESGWPTRRM